MFLLLFSSLRQKWMDIFSEFFDMMVDGHLQFAGMIFDGLAFLFPLTEEFIVCVWHEGIPLFYTIENRGWCLNA